MRDSSLSATATADGRPWRRWLGATRMARPIPARRGHVIALHCSGAGAGQWRALGEALGPGYELAAPEHYGCERTGPWSGEHAFTLADEAARTVDLIDRCGKKVHLVGHSYGGGVALNVALARPDRIASLALYEPSAFHLLKALGDQGAAAYQEIAELARETGDSVVSGDFTRAAISFVVYWGGSGAWAALRPSVQAALIRWVAKAPLDFHALMAEPTPIAAYAGLRMPTLVLRGEHAPRPTRLIAGLLTTVLPAARPAVLDGAGHMGPTTHADAVNELIVAHIDGVDAVDRATEAPGGQSHAGESGAEIAHRVPEPDTGSESESIHAAVWQELVGWKGWRALLDAK